MSNEQIASLLVSVLGVLVFIVFILIIAYVVLKTKNKKGSTEKSGVKQNSEKSQIEQNYNKQSIFSFMEFDKIEDNMIVQKNGNKYLMVVECQGINYDLMSGVEKNSVEQGFLQFLNTLRYPIQIYVQTRTVNLESSVGIYKDKIKEIGDKLIREQMDYNTKVKEGFYTPQELARQRFEITKQRNLYEYGLDIVENTERMSLNKNILSKHYYVIIPYSPEEVANSDFDREEIRNLAFSELYTRAQATISALAVCDINSKVLDSTDLAELLYVSYNRDESETYDLNKAINAGYDELYRTAQDVLEKRMRELDLKAEEEAIRKANEAILQVVEEDERKRKIKEKEENLNKQINKMAKMIIEENKSILGQETAKKAKKKIDDDEIEESKGGKVDDIKQQTKKTRRTTKTA